MIETGYSLLLHSHGALNMLTTVLISASVTFAVIQPEPIAIDQPAAVLELLDPSRSSDSFGSVIQATDKYLLVLAPINNSSEPARHHVYETDTLKWLHKVAPEDQDRLGKSAPIIACDGESMAVAYPERQVTINQIETGKPLVTIPIPEGRDAWRFGAMMAIDTTSSRVVFAASNMSGQLGKLASSYVALHDLKTGDRITQLSAPEVNAKKVQFGARLCIQDDLVIVGTAIPRELNDFRKSLLNDEEIQQLGIYLFDAQTGKFLKKFEGERDEADTSFGRVIMASEQYLVITGLYTIYIYNKKTLALHGKLEIEQVPGNSAFDENSIALDGNLLAVGISGSHPIKNNGIVNIYDINDQTLRYKIVPSGLKENDRFGSEGVEIKNNRVYASATGDSRKGSSTGVVYVFDLPKP